MDNQTSRISPPEPSRRLIVAGRLLLLLTALGALGAAVLIGTRDRVQGAAGYACPMHPEVRSGEQGRCPICRMALEPQEREAQHAAAGTLAVENVRRHRILDVVRKRALLLPVQELRGPAFVDEGFAVVATLYDDQIAAIAAGEEAVFSPASAPARAFKLRRTPEAPVRWDGSTSRIRFTGARLQPGTAGWLSLPRKPREVLTVPASAIVNGPEGPYVLTAGFEKRPVEIGETFVKQGFAVVRSGLDLHERVVSRATFFLDAARKLDEGDGQ